MLGVETIAHIGILASRMGDTVQALGFRATGPGDQVLPLVS